MRTRHVIPIVYFILHTEYYILYKGKHERLYHYKTKYLNGMFPSFITHSFHKGFYYCSITYGFQIFMFIS